MSVKRRVCFVVNQFFNYLLVRTMGIQTVLLLNFERANLLLVFSINMMTIFLFTNSPLVIYTVMWKHEAANVSGLLLPICKLLLPPVMLGLFAFRIFCMASMHVKPAFIGLICEVIN